MKTHRLACSHALIKYLIAQKIIFDGKNFLNQKLIQDLGFEYFAVGRKIKSKK